LGNCRGPPSRDSSLLGRLFLWLRVTCALAAALVGLLTGLDGVPALVGEFAVVFPHAGAHGRPVADVVGTVLHDVGLAGPIARRRPAARRRGEYGACEAEAEEQGGKVSGLHLRSLRGLVTGCTGEPHDPVASIVRSTAMVPESKPGPLYWWHMLRGVVIWRS